MSRRRIREPPPKSANRLLVESVVASYIEDWSEDGRTIMFRTSEPIKLALLNKLAETFGTDAINFNFGSEGSPGYSEVTPGEAGAPGYIEITLTTEPT